MNFKYSTKDIVESAMLVALAVVLDLAPFKIQLNSAGGSISFTMLPLLILCLRQGPFKGFIGAGLVYGLITCVIDGHNFIYFPFDYLLAYGSLCVVGIFNKLIMDEKHKARGAIILILMTIFALVLRIIFHSISSIVNFGFSLIPSLVYNLSYVGPAGVICLLALLGVQRILMKFINKTNKSID